MSTKFKRLTARQSYESGFALFQRGDYEEAVAEARKAGDAYRKLDATGHPFGFTLPNKVSGLANALALEGRCRQKLGDYQGALNCYENSLINVKFEKNRPFHLFWSDLVGDVIACYETELEKTDPETLQNLKQDPPIDISYVFPFSLPQDLIPAARLYELVPDRYPQFSDFYTASKRKDARIRVIDKRSDESTTKKLSVYVWGILIAIWAAYGITVIRALTQQP